MALRTNVAAGTLAGPWAYNDFYQLLTGQMQDQHVTLQTNVSLKSRGAAPGSASAAVASSGSVDIGAHTYKVTFVGPNSGETVAGTGVVATTTSGNQTVNLTAIPTGPAGTSSRNIYRSKAGTTSPLYLLHTIADNTTTTYTDTATDASLPTTQPPTHSSFGGTLYVTDNTGAVKGMIYQDGAVSFDNGNITSDGAGNLTVVSITTGGGNLTVSTLTVGAINTSTGTGTLYITSDQSGAANGVVFHTWNGTAQVVPFSVGGAGGLAYVDATGMLRFAHTLSASNQIMDLQQGFALWSDNAGGYYSGSNKRLWFDCGDAVSEMHLGGRTSTNVLKGLRIRALVFTLDDNTTTLAFNTHSLATGATFFGFRVSSGKVAEINSSGVFTVSGSNPCFMTTAATVGFASGGSFDTFDISEAFPTDHDYPYGTVLCPGPDHKLTRCTHDGCRAALVVSQQGAMAIGMGSMEGEETDPNVKPVALAGRVLVSTNEDIPAFAADGQPTLVCSDGQGGVRRMLADEWSYALGYALHDAENGKLGIVVRPMYCKGA